MGVCVCVCCYWKSLIIIWWVGDESNSIQREWFYRRVDDRDRELFFAFIPIRLQGYYISSMKGKTSKWLFLGNGASINYIYELKEYYFKFISKQTDAHTLDYWYSQRIFSLIRMCVIYRRYYERRLLSIHFSDYQSSKICVEWRISNILMMITLEWFIINFHLLIIMRIITSGHCWYST